MNGKPIRILHYIGCLELGGSQAMIMNIYRNIDRKKIQFDFIVDKEVESPYEKEIISLGGKIYKFKHHFNGINYFQYKKQWEQFFKNHYEYEILHSHVRSTASIVFKIAKKSKITTIAHSHSTSNGKGLKAIAKKILQKRISKNCDIFLACSEESANWLFGKKTIDEKGCTIINNSIDATKYTFNNLIRQNIRKQFGIDKKIVIGQIGRFDKPKNQEYSIEILKKLLKENKNYILMLIGAGPQKQKIIEMVSKYNLTNNVIFLENRTDINKLMQAMDVFIMPSLYEGLPLSLVEAQAASLPCIISENIQSGIINNKIVHKIKLSNSEEWIKKIIEVSKQARNTNNAIYDSEFDINNNINKITGLYEKLYTNKRRNKILFCIGSMRHGGAERVISNLSNYFISTYDVIIVTTIKSEIEYELNKKISVLSLDEDGNRKNFIYRTHHRITKLRKILKEESPDIAIAFLPEPSFRIMISKIFLDIPTIISVRNDPNREYDTAFKKLLVKLLYTPANGFVFQTPEAKQWFSNAIQAKSVIIPNPIDNKYYKNPFDGNREKVIVSIGRLTKQKNQKLLINSFYNFYKKHNDYKLKVYGDGPLRNELQAQIDEMGIKDHAILMGETNDIPKEIYKATAFIMTSDYEGMPNALMEAMALGLPCISTDCPIGGPKYLIKNQKNGVLVKCHDSRKIEQSLNRIVTDKKYANSLSSQAAKTAINFKINIVASQWEKAIINIISSKPINN